MLEYLKYDENNVKTVCEMDGFHADMGMNIWVRILQPGQKLEFCSDTLETAALLLAGRVKFCWGDRCEDCARENPFDLKPWTLHVSRNSAFSVEAVEESRVLIQQTDNDKEWEPRFYTPENCLCAGPSDMRVSPKRELNACISICCGRSDQFPPNIQYNIGLKPNCQSFFGINADFFRENL